jgi:hypothetical protein
MTGGQLARALGWFSLGLGLVEVVAPRKLGKLIGVNGNRIRGWHSDQRQLRRPIIKMDVGSGRG